MYDGRITYDDVNDQAHEKAFKQFYTSFLDCAKAPGAGWMVVDVFAHY